MEYLGRNIITWRRTSDSWNILCCLPSVYSVPILLPCFKSATLWAMGRDLSSWLSNFSFGYRGDHRKSRNPSIYYDNPSNSSSSNDSYYYIEDSNMIRRKMAKGRPLSLQVSFPPLPTVLIHLLFHERNLRTEKREDQKDAAKPTCSEACIFSLIC